MLQSFDLQRVLEGEKALRTEAARQLKEVEKKLVSLRSPAVSLSSPMMAPPGSLSSLEREQDQLQQQIRAHSAQVSHYFGVKLYAPVQWSSLSFMTIIDKRYCWC